MHQYKFSLTHCSPHFPVHSQLSVLQPPKRSQAKERDADMKNQPLLDRKSCASRKHKTPHLFCIDLLEAAESAEFRAPENCLAWAWAEGVIGLELHAGLALVLGVRHSGRAEIGQAGIHLACI